MVLDPAKEKEAECVFRKWGLDFAIIGETKADLRFTVRHYGAVKADLPIKELGDAAPLYDRPSVVPPRRPILDPATIKPPLPHAQALLALLATPALCSKRWIYEQYDHLILGNTVVPPGGDAAVIRIDNGPKGLALTTDVTERYCAADPREGGRQAVAEAWRNLTAVGALPLAITDNLNFGNPEKPEIMGQLIFCLEGIGEAAQALDFPIVSGNVSLYNESAGQAILPTPAIGGVGLISDLACVATLPFKQPGEKILLVGETSGWLGASLYLREICGRDEGAPPPVDLAVEKRHGDFVRGLIAGRSVTAVHDISDGGLAAALAKMAIAGRLGASVLLSQSLPVLDFLFGEDQARYVLTARPAQAEAILTNAQKAGIACTMIGETGGDKLTLGTEAAILVTELAAAYENWLPRYMNQFPA